MSEKKIRFPMVLARRLCPVCGKPSYSATGTHPQCALARADNLAREARRAAGPPPAKPVRKSWCKPCPKCHREVPSRRFACECGHKFIATTANNSDQTAADSAKGGQKQA